MASSSPALPEPNPANTPVSSPAVVKTVEVAPSLAESALPAAPASTGIMIRIDPVDAKAVSPGATSMRAILASAENGAAYLAEAQQVADKIDLSNLSAILEHGQASRDALSSLSTEILGTRRIGESGPIEALFTELTQIHQVLDVSSLNRPLTKFQEIASYVTNFFHPMVAFARRYQALTPQIDIKEQTLKTLEAESVENQNDLKSLKAAVINGFRSLEVSIAAGEIVLERELKKFEIDREAQRDSADVVKRQELNDRRLALMNLDNRVMRLQVARGDSIMDLPMIDLALDNEIKLRGTLEDIRTISIPQIRKGVVIATSIYDQRKAVKIAGNQQQFAAMLRKANLDALGMAQEETHELATSAAKEVQELVKDMGKLSDLVTRGNELLLKNRELNENARVELGKAEGKFKSALQSALDDQSI